MLPRATEANLRRRFLLRQPCRPDGYNLLAGTPPVHLTDPAGWCQGRRLLIGSRGLSGHLSTGHCSMVLQHYINRAEANTGAKWHFSAATLAVSCADDRWPSQ